MNVNKLYIALLARLAIMARMAIRAIDSLLHSIIATMANSDFSYFLLKLLVCGYFLVPPLGGRTVAPLRGEATWTKHRRGRVS